MLSKKGLWRMQRKIASQTCGFKRMLKEKSQDFARTYASMLAAAREICSRKEPPQILEVQYLLLCLESDRKELTES